MQIVQFMPPGDVKGHHLPHGMDTCIRTSGANNTRLCTGKAAQRRLEHTLHRAATRLKLKPQEVCAIVGNGRSYVLHFILTW